MCGACGSGIPAAPWEAQLVPLGIGGRRELARAAAAAYPQSRKRIQANAFGVGYVISGPSGGAKVANSIDDVVDELHRDSAPATALLAADSSIATFIVALSSARHTGEPVGRLFAIDGALVHARVVGGTVSITRGDAVGAADVPAVNAETLTRVSVV